MHERSTKTSNWSRLFTAVEKLAVLMAQACMKFLLWDLASRQMVEHLEHKAKKLRIVCFLYVDYIPIPY